MKLSNEIQKIIDGKPTDELIVYLSKKPAKSKNNGQSEPLINLEQKKLIKEGFRRLKTKKDLLNLLNYTKKLMFGEKYTPIKLKSLLYFANPEFCKSRYHQFTIPKKSGKNRTINAPVKGLKSILRVLNTVLSCIHNPNEQAVGFVSGKSIVDGAKKHTQKNYVYNIDLADFFHSFDRRKVKSGFLQPPFNMRGQKEPLAFLLACLCTHPFKINGEEKIVLPQGSPTSPVITNILCQRLDRRLNGLAKRFSCTYSRYADDITFSCQRNVFKEVEFKDELNKIIREQNLQIQPTKTRLLINRGSRRQEVTGLVVNDKANVKRKYVKEVRMWLYYWEKYGFERANLIFQSRYVAKHKKRPQEISSNDFIKVLAGKIEFINMVQGNESQVGSRLKNRLINLKIKNQPTQESWKYAKKIALKIEKLDELNEDELNEIALKLLNWNDPEKIEIFNLVKQNFSQKLILTRLNKPKNEINQKDVEKNKLTDYEESYRSIKITHQPQQLVETLKKFGRDGVGILKYVSHLWDSKANTAHGFKSYNEFTKKLHKENIQVTLREVIEQYNRNLWWQKIYPFVFQKEFVASAEKDSYHWGRHKIKLGWQYPSTLKDWCETNVDKKENGKQPFSMRIPKELRPKELINFKSITTFQDVAELFINEIRFSEGYFIDVIQDLIIDKLEGMNVDDSHLESLKDFTAYTNTEFVLNALEVIFKMIQENANESCNDLVIKSSLISEENKFVLEILHLNSICPLPPEHEKLSGNYGKLSLVREKLFGLCDFSIKGRFTENNKPVFSEINYLSKGDFRRQNTINKNEYSGYSEATINKIEDPGGFALYLSFYI